MHVENFKIFADLVESGSFSRAAKLNGITQSAVSQQLRNMERHFGSLMVDRGQKQFRLTPEGEKLYHGGKEILHRYQKMQSELQEMKKIFSGTIRLATIYSIGLHALPPYLKSFLQTCPHVNVRVEYRRSNMVYEDVLHNAADLGMVAFPARQRRVETIPFLEDEMILICHPGHRLAKRGEVSLSQLAREKFIGFEKDIPTRKATDQVFREAKIEVEPVMEFDNIETVKRAVEIDAGVAIVPQATVAVEVKQNQLRALPFRGKSFVRPMAVIYRRGRVMTPAIKKFLQMLAERRG